MRLVAALAALSVCTGCAVLPPDPPKHQNKVESEGMRVQWVRMDNVTKECGSALGCYRIRGGTCYVYTRHATEIFDNALHQTLGHELRHCFDGDFHGSESQIVLMNRWKGKEQ